MRQLRKGQRVRATVLEEQGGSVLCRKGDLGTVIAVKDQTVAFMNWDNYGNVFPTTIDYLQRVDGREGEPIVEGVEVLRTRPLMDGKGGQLLAAHQKGTVVALKSRVGVAVLFDPPAGTTPSRNGPVNAVWMSRGIRPVDVALGIASRETSAQGFGDLDEVPAIPAERTEVQESMNAETGVLNVLQSEDCDGLDTMEAGLPSLCLQKTHRLGNAEIKEVDMQGLEKLLGHCRPWPYYMPGTCCA
jgi:hypothetical protein